LLRTPVVAELLDRRAREVAAERQGLADQLATIARELDEGATAYTKTIAPLTAKATAAREALQIAASALLAQRQAYELVVHSCAARAAAEGERASRDQRSDHGPRSPVRRRPRAPVSEQGPTLGHAQFEKRQGQRGDRLERAGYSAAVR
jgi:hypothetical protein